MEDLNLDAAGLMLTIKGTLSVSQHCQTEVPHNYAGGDMVGAHLLGVQIVGESATELVHVGQSALQQGATIEPFIGNVFTSRPMPKPIESPRWIFSAKSPPRYTEPPDGPGPSLP